MYHMAKVRCIPDEDGHFPRFRELWLDDQRIEGITRMDAHWTVDEIPTLQLEIQVRGIEIDDGFETTIKKTHDPAVLDAPICMLDLSARSYNGLMRGCIAGEGVSGRDNNQTVGDVLTAYRNGRLKKYHCIGKQSYKEIVGKLKGLNLIKEDGK